MDPNFFHIAYQNYRQSQQKLGSFLEKHSYQKMIKYKSSAPRNWLIFGTEGQKLAWNI